MVVFDDAVIRRKISTVKRQMRRRYLSATCVVVREYLRKQQGHKDAVSALLPHVHTDFLGGLLLRLEFLERKGIVDIYHTERGLMCRLKKGKQAVKAAKKIEAAEKIHAVKLAEHKRRKKKQSKKLMEIKTKNPKFRKMKHRDLKSLMKNMKIKGAEREKEEVEVDKLNTKRNKRKWTKKEKMERRQRDKDAEKWVHDILMEDAEKA